jgi:hypothetical protein
MGLLFEMLNLLVLKVGINSTRIKNGILLRFVLCRSSKTIFDIMAFVSKDVYIDNSQSCGLVQIMCLKH